MQGKESTAVAFILHHMQWFSLPFSHSKRKHELSYVSNHS